MESREVNNEIIIIFAKLQIPSIYNYNSHDDQIKCVARSASHHILLFYGTP